MFRLSELRKFVIYLQVCIKDGEEIKMKIGKGEIFFLFLIEETATYVRNRCKDSRKYRGSYGRGMLRRIQGHINCKTRGTFIGQSF